MIRQCLSSSIKMINGHASQKEIKRSLTLNRDIYIILRLCWYRVIIVSHARLQCLLKPLTGPNYWKALTRFACYNEFNADNALNVCVNVCVTYEFQILVHQTLINYYAFIQNSSAYYAPNTVDNWIASLKIKKKNFQFKFRQSSKDFPQFLVLYLIISIMVMWKFFVYSEWISLCIKTNYYKIR